MSSNIKLVQGDNRPNVDITLSNSDGTPLDVSTATVVVYFRKAGAKVNLATLACTKPTGGADGKVRFNFPGTTLSVDPGSYEGEVEVTFADASKQTVYEILKFTVRAQFA